MAAPAANPFDDPASDLPDVAAAATLEEMVRTLLARSTRAEQSLTALENRMHALEMRDAASRPVPRSPF